MCDNPIGYFHREDGLEVLASCKSWRCPQCAKVKKNQVLDRARDGFVEIQANGHRVRAVTLTLGPSADNRLMGKYFARLRSWLAKPRIHRGKLRSFRHINYFWTKEFQKNGQLHLHILIDAYIPWRLLKRAWSWATYNTSNIIFITKIHNAIYNPAGYMTKYMSKEMESDQQESFRKGERRFGFSRGKIFAPRIKVPDHRWTFHLGGKPLFDPDLWQIAYNLKADGRAWREDPDG